MASMRNADALNKNIRKITERYIQHYETMLTLLPMDNVDKATTGVTEMMMGVETAGLVRVAEDTLRLVRQLQELWLFGNLDALGKSDAEVRTEGNAKAVAEGIEALVKKEDVGEREL